MILAFLGQKQTLAMWFDHLVSGLLGTIITALIMGLLVSPMIIWTRNRIKEHLAYKKREVVAVEATANAQNDIANRLNTHTPGGLTDVVDAVNARNVPF